MREGMPGDKVEAADGSAAAQGMPPQPQLHNHAAPPDSHLIGTPAAIRCFTAALQDAPPQPHQAYVQPTLAHSNPPVAGGVRLKVEGKLCRHEYCANCMAIQLQGNLDPASQYRTEAESQALILRLALEYAAFPDWRQRIAADAAPANPASLRVSPPSAPTFPLHASSPPRIALCRRSTELSWRRPWKSWDAGTGSTSV